MKKFLSITAIALLSSTMVLTSIISADAHWKNGRRHSHGGAAAGIAGAIIGGAIIGGAIANSNRRRSNRHCHRGYCHTHNYQYSDHRHRPTVYERPRRRPAPRRDYGDRHEEWCYDRYRSYRAYDNTYQPYNGRRRSCRSPYG